MKQTHLIDRADCREVERQTFSHEACKRKKNGENRQLLGKKVSKKGYKSVRLSVNDWQDAEGYAIKTRV